MADIELVIKIPEEMWERIKDGYVPLGISKYLQNGTPIPDNATNGDVLKAMFPNIEVEEQGKDLFIVFNMDVQGTPFYKAWWNAPYQKGGKE